MGKMAGRDAGWETSLEFGVRWGSHAGCCVMDPFHILFFFRFFWLWWVFVAVGGLSLVLVSRCCSFLLCASFSLWWFCCRAWAPVCAGFRSGSQALGMGSAVVASSLSCSSACLSVVSDSLRPRDCSPPGFPVLYHLPELAQTHVR